MHILIRGVLQGFQEGLEADMWITCARFPTLTSTVQSLLPRMWEWRNTKPAILAHGAWWPRFTFTFPAGGKARVELTALVLTVQTVHAAKSVLSNEIF